MASARELDALIRVSGEVDRSVRRAIENISDQMDALQAAARAAQGSSAELSDTIKKQGKTLQAAQAKYASYVLNGQEASEEAKELANNIRELSSDLNRNRAALSAAEEAAARLAQGTDDAGDSVDDLSESAKGSSGGFTVMKGVIADLISNGIQKLISTAIDGAKALYGLSEETREFRQDMATLETAFDKAGFTADVATSTWKDLYAIFGEDDRAVETANNISRMAKTQEELQQWTKITTGIWGEYIDALPVEGLAEAAAETAKVGDRKLCRL